MASSFQKKSKGKIFQINGTKKSLQNNQLLVSTGVPSLDTILGGGIAVGTVLLIEEDTYGSYGRMLLKYQLAETIMCGHSLLLAAAHQSPDLLLQELPGAIVDEPKEEVKSSGTGNEETMKIAWRYQNLPQVQSTPKCSNRFGHYYDLTKTMDEGLVNTADKTIIDVSEDAPQCHCGDPAAMNKTYYRVLQTIQEKIKEGGFSTKIQSSDRSILRVCLSSLGSPLWGEDVGSSGGVGMHYDPSLGRFLYALRSLMRTAFATCVITMPTHLFQDAGFTKRMRHLCDTVIRLESFTGSDKEKNPAYKEYHGLFHIEKLPRLNSLLSHVPDTLDLAFKLRRKKFTIEKLHLPPDLSETASRDQEDPLKNLRATPGAPCATSTGNSKLDF